MIKIIVIIRKHHAYPLYDSLSTKIRLLEPLNNISKMNILSFQYTSVHENSKYLNEFIEWADFIFINRSINFKLLENIQKYKSKKIIYDIDDFIFKYPESHPNHNLLNKNIYVAEKFLKYSHKITVSNMPLYEYLIKNYSFISRDKITLLESPSSSKFKPYDRTKAHKNILLVSGDRIKLDDNKSNFINAVNDFLVKNNEQIFYIGDKNEDIDLLLNVNYIGRLDFDVLNKYINRQNFLLALIPLDNKDCFSKYKSVIKYINFAENGLPGIFSDVYPYNSVIRNFYNGLIVKNSYQAWNESIELLYKNESLRENIVTNAQKHVRLNYSNEQFINFLKKLIF